MEVVLSGEKEQLILWTRGELGASSSWGRICQPNKVGHISTDPRCLPKATSQSLAAVVQLLSGVRLFMTTLTAACQASLSFAVSQSLLKLMSIESVMPSNHLMLCHPFFFCLHLSQHQSPMRELFISGGQNIGASASASVLPMHIQDLFPLKFTGLISLLSRDFQVSSPTLQFKSMNSLILSLLYGPTLTYVHDYWKNHSFDYTDLFQQSDVSVF